VNLFKEKKFKDPTIYFTAKIYESSKSAYDGGFRGILNQYYQTYALLTGSSLFSLVAPYLFLLKLTVNSY